MIKLVFVQKTEIGRHYRPFHRDSHPLLVPVLQKKKGSKVSKAANKERLENYEDPHLTYIIILAMCFFTSMCFFLTRLKDERNIDDLLSFIEGPCANDKKEKKKKAKKGLK